MKKISEEVLINLSLVPLIPVIFKNTKNKELQDLIQQAEEKVARIRKQKVLPDTYKLCLYVHVDGLKDDLVILYRERFEHILELVGNYYSQDEIL